MPKLTKSQKRLVDILQEGGAEIILSRGGENPYLYIYYINAKPKITRLSDKTFNPLWENNVFEATGEDELGRPVLELYPYKLQEYLEKKSEEV